jgi:23S rRNA pseudouridine2605 synthase
MKNGKPKRESKQHAESEERSGSERLQKVLAAAGIGSRRDCEQLILEGRVEVERKMVTELGTKVDPTQQEIRVDGVTLHRPKLVYFILNKPTGVICTNFDPAQRTRVIDLIPTEVRVFPVGRLDRGSEGLILVTNDGALANRVTHPRYGLEKTYQVRVAGNPSDEELMQLRRGVRLAEGIARVVSFKVRKRYRQHTDLEIVLNEGKNREIRRILAKVGHKVMQLRRISIGPIRLADLPVGASRKLVPREVQELLAATDSRRKSVIDYRATKRNEAKTETSESGEHESMPAKKASAKISPAKASPAKSKPQTQQRPIVAAGAAPPKLDLASLLNPKLAPKTAVAITPASELPATPSVGDVLPFNEQESGEFNYVAPQREPKKRRGVERKMAEFAAEAGSIFAPPPEINESDELREPEDRREPRRNESRSSNPRRGASNRSGARPSRSGTGRSGTGRSEQRSSEQRQSEPRRERSSVGKKKSATKGRKPAARGFSSESSASKMPRGLRADARRTAKGSRPTSSNRKKRRR